VEERYPPIEPSSEGMLEVGDGNRIAWRVAGAPDGIPAVVVHGGPGSGCAPGLLRYFDPARYRIVAFDQRGCGGSTPHASDPATDMSVNTTERLVADMERLRDYLDIDRWLLFGGSWGSTLSLAYAVQHPERVRAMVLTAVTTGRHTEVDWLFGGVARLFPEAWEAFCAGVPEADRDADLLGAYARRMSDPDPDVRRQAALDWTAWEDAVISFEVQGKPDAYSDRPPRDREAMVRIASHYFSNGLFLEDGALVREAHRLEGTPGVLIHGRLDLGGPLDNAWTLARAWPDAELVVVDDAGHTGSPAMAATIRGTLDRFADDLVPDR
jgi:proline iminopeptidase